MKLKMFNRNALVAAIMMIVIMFGTVPMVTPAAASSCDWAQFVSDVTIPDGTYVTAGTAFTKTWQIRNIGTCTWTSSYSLAFVDGSQMGAPLTVALTGNVVPGATVNVSAAMTAPASAGTYRGNWQMKNAGGTNFGIGSAGNLSFWVEIKVSGSSSTTGYDFAANASSATWSTGAGNLTGMGTDGSANGYAKVLAAPVLENGVTDTSAAILTVPPSGTSTFIQGIYPAFSVLSGDRFSAIFNCQYGASTCYINFKLNYQIGTGTVQTLYAFSERYEGLYYRANIDLSSLAGQSVKFILYVDSAGSATGDLAMWGAPKIVRGSVVTPSATPAGATVTPGTSGCDRATFIDDVNVPDGTVFGPNASFTKTWRIKNVGTCTWTTAYKLVYVSGNQMGGPATQNLTSTIGPNTSFDISVPLVSPSSAGAYRGYWQLKNASGILFGIGYYADKPWWVDISVNSSIVVPTNTPGSGLSPTNTPAPTNTTTPSSGTVFDFTANPAGTTWTNNSTGITFGGIDPDVAGLAKKLTSVTMEGGAAYTQNALLMVPKDQVVGYVKGVFPAFTLTATDHFQAIIGCQYGADSCWVSFILDYQEVGSSTVHNLITFTERNEGTNRPVDIDLSTLAGKNVQFTITTLAANGTSGAVDRAVWLAPRITR